MKNKSEEFVFKVCKETFLSLWSYANPLGKNRKELCDILVVCEPDIIIFSVKEIRVSESGDVEADWKRWNRRAVEESAKQICGAERWLKSAPHVIRCDGSPGLNLPAGKEQVIHRIVVALGGKDKVPIIFGDFGKGFVHVLDDISFHIVLQELDTISDFIDYLSAKERFYMSGKETPLLAGEENLLAFYLHYGRQFPEKVDSVFLEPGLWEAFIKKPEYIKKKEADKISYAWDAVISDISQHVLKGTLEYTNDPGKGELILRIMARENRFSRRILGKSFIEFIHLSSQNKLRARMMPSPSGILYVLLAHPHEIDRKYRRAELGMRCFIARGLNKEFKTVIGIATEQYQPGQGHSFDLCYRYMPDWTEANQAELESLQKKTGFFVNSAKTESHEDEYPQN